MNGASFSLELSVYKRDQEFDSCYVDRTDVVEESGSKKEVQK